MKTNYIFIKKNEKSNKGEINYKIEIYPIKSLLRNLFSFLDENKFEITIDGKKYEAAFKNLKRAKGSYFIEISVDYSPSVNALVLDCIRNTIIKGEHRSKYNIVIANDDSSKHYGTTLMPYFNTFERSLRQLVFYILIESFGADWCKRISPKLEKELADRGVKGARVIEEALYELTSYQLEVFLFGTQSEVPNNDEIDNLIKKNKETGLSKEKIDELLSNLKNDSLWNRLFKDKIEIENVHDKLRDIRNYRNQIAHNKIIQNNEFLCCRNLLKELTKDIDRAVIKFENESLPHIEIDRILHALGSLKESIDAIWQLNLPNFESFSKALADMRRVLFHNYEDDVE